MKVRIRYIDALVIGLLLFFYIFAFLGEVVLALVLFGVAIAVSLAALLKARSGHANKRQGELKEV